MGTPLTDEQKAARKGAALTRLGLAFLDGGRAPFLLDTVSTYTGGADIYDELVWAHQYDVLGDYFVEVAP